MADPVCCLLRSPLILGLQQAAHAAAKCMMGILQEAAWEVQLGVQVPNQCGLLVSTSMTLQ